MCQQFGITSLMTVPTIMEDIIALDNFEEAARILSQLDFVAVGGGGLRRSTGDVLHAKQVKILNHFGATELGALAPIFRPSTNYDHHYLRLRTDLDLKLTRLDASHGERACKLTGYPFGWDRPFELQDQLEYNPLNPNGEVQIVGRNDDVIVLATGEKVLPNMAERILEQEPSIRRAVMFGQGQAETGVLIEPAGEVDEEAFRREIEPVLQRANELLDGHARIASSAILIKPIDKPIPLSDKGVPQRNQVYADFEAEINEMYERLGLDSVMEVGNDIRVSLRSMAQRCLPAHQKPNAWSDDDDLINLGMDSLQATQLRRILVASFTSSSCPIPNDFVYANPSVGQMANALAMQQQKPSPLETMEALVRSHAFTPETSRPNGSFVLLTGSTGSLGSYLLQALLRRPTVHRVICLMRLAGRKDLKSRQVESLELRGIALSEREWSKVEFFEWEPGQDRLGLHPDSYQYVTSAATDIFHSAWPMDFQRKLTSFEPQIQALCDLVQLGRDIYSRQGIRPRLIFASSIAAVGRYPFHGAVRLVPEEPPTDPQTALPMGYSEAKWVCEKVMESAYGMLRTELQPIVVRIGQLVGSQQTGYWSTSEHLAALTKAAQKLQRMPDLKGVCDSLHHSSLLTF